jgi:U4/U6.U5 tri-snRNP-associated protein 1
MAEASVNQDSLDLDETNKLRISMGLAPIGAEVLDADGEVIPDEDDVAEANFAERRAEMKKARADKEMQESIAK